MKKRLLILGGGFVGTSIAVQLARQQRADLEITLISSSAHFLFSPLLIDVLAQELTPEQSTLSLPDLAQQHGFTFSQGDILQVDREQRLVTYRTGDGADAILPYDYLVLATGAKVNYYNIPGAETYCLPLKTEVDAQHLWKKLLEVFPPTKSAKKNIALIGGGPTGIEALYAIKSFFTHQHIDQTGISFHLFEATPSVLPGFDPVIQQKVHDMLRKDQVTIHLGKPVQRVEQDQIILADEVIPSQIVLWCAGIQANLPPLVPAPTGPLCPDAFLRLDDVTFVAGDVATIECNGKRLPKTGQVALQLAKTMGQNIIHTLDQTPLVPAFADNQSMLLSLGKTGIVKFGSVILQTRWTSSLRRTLYRIRRWQIQHGL